MEDARPTKASDQTISEVPAEVEVHARGADASAGLGPAEEPASAGMVLSPVTRWARVARLPTLICSVAPVLVAGVLLWARGAAVSLPLLVLTMVAVGVAHAGANVLDAHLDQVREQARTRLEPDGSASGRMDYSASTLAAAGIYPLDALRASGGLLLLGAVLGVPLAIQGGWPVLALGVAGLVVAVLFSATSYALERLPLGEIAAFLALGPGLVILTVLSQRQQVTALDVAVGAGLGLFATAVLEAANLRASAPEVRDGRLTLVRLLGPGLGRWLFVLCLLGAYAVVVDAALQKPAPHGALAVLLSLPAAVVPLTGGLRAQGAGALVAVVRGTLRAYTAFAFWLVMGLLLGALYLRLLAVLGG